ncbi:MAG: hypothetical protein H6721_13860 [Sandaracinus sp.]|nr:hypothetical protein [Sandaracinus sp.]MCB9619760.1 hypothetical protein [Sandaracinus sp.]MCB9633202.1 hypothetical protein [Sandaracinus sp.]
MDAFVEVVKPDGTQERYPVEGAQVTLGKSGTAGISIPTANELELEHLLIAPRGKEGVWVSTSQGALTPTLLKGKPFVNGMVPWQAELVIGRIRIRVTNKRASAKGEGQQVSPVIVLAAVVVLAGAAWMMLKGGGQTLPSAEGLEPPPIFTDVPSTCPANGDARDLEYRAHSRGDRFRYELRDGVEAVKLYAQAAACYRGAGDVERATEMERQRDEMREAMDADYAARRLRMHHALSTENWEEASVEARALSSMLVEVPDDNAYKTWLERTRRIVQARYDKSRESRRKKRR